MKLLTAIPRLPSSNLNRTLDFYNEKLEFERGFMTDDYASTLWDYTEIHFWKCNDKYIAENSGCYIVCEDVDALYNKYKLHDIIHPNGHLENKPWSMREFAILDPDGNLLVFGEKVSK